MRKSGPVVKQEATDWGGVKLTFANGSAVQVTQAHWDAIVAYVKSVRDA